MHLKRKCGNGARAEKIGEERGRKAGLAQGEAAKQQEIARKMLEMKMALDIISKATGLTEQELKLLKTKI